MRVCRAVVGGESGHGARPMDPSWVRSLRDQCRQARVPFFFKQWGGVRKSIAGRQLDGGYYDELPPRAVATMPPRARRIELLQSQTALV